MSYITIDPFYNVNFYNETLEALKNNDVDYKELISTKAPYNFYLNVQNLPMFINFEQANSSYTKFLINIIKPLKTDQAYIYRRRDSYTALKGVQHYGINDALRTGQESGEGIFISLEKDEAYRISRDYPRRLCSWENIFNENLKYFLLII